MENVIAAVARLTEAEPLIENHSVPAWAFGVFAFSVLVLLLIITTMLKVDR